MNATAVARHYGSLTPEERFRLILAAGARGDKAEQDRLASAGGRITLSVPDFSPHARAFADLELITFVELLDAAATYLELFHRAGEDGPPDEAEGGHEEG